MIETYRMLGREHEADLAREAEKWQHASLVQAKAKRRDPASIVRRNSLRWLAPARLVRPAARAAARARDGVRALEPHMHTAGSASPVGASSQTTEGERR